MTKCGWEWERETSNIAGMFNIVNWIIPQCTKRAPRFRTKKISLNPGVEVGSSLSWGVQKCRPKKTTYLRKYISRVGLIGPRVNIHRFSINWFGGLWTWFRTEKTLRANQDPWSTAGHTLSFSTGGLQPQYIGGTGPPNKNANWWHQRQGQPVGRSENYHILVYRPIISSPRLAQCKQHVW